MIWLRRWCLRFRDWVTGVTWAIRQMEAYEEAFPGKCGFCSFFRQVMNETPPPHEPCKNAGKK